MTQKEISLILHDIRSSENVGSMFRTADAAGVKKIYLTGYTPAPLDRFKRKNSKLAKAALGAEETVLWERAEDAEVLIKKLKGEGVSVFAVEQDPRSVSYEKAMIPEKIAFIMGNEVEGVSKNILDVCDAILEIPMHGKKESMNVSVAAGVVLFRARDF
ncbi:RNA methyltransferase [Patescibacteria group bacterium]|nr:RNA methyltransferase [Patescibacteria group bacterium]